MGVAGIRCSGGESRRKGSRRNMSSRDGYRRSWM